MGERFQRVCFLIADTHVGIQDVPVLTMPHEGGDAPETQVVVIGQCFANLWQQSISACTGDKTTSWEGELTTVISLNFADETRIVVYIQFYIISEI